MSKAIKWVGEFQGNIIERKTARVYSHAVVYLVNAFAAQAADEKAARKAHRDSVAYWTRVPTPAFEAEMAANVRPIGRDGNSVAHDWDLKFYAEYIVTERAKAADELAKLNALGEDGAALEAIKRHEKRNAKAMRSADGQDYVVVAGWAGRPDLAAKLAAQHSRAYLVPVAPAVKVVDRTK